MSFLNNPDIAKLLLRLGVGLLMLFHGVAKLIKGVDGIKGMLSYAGLPELMAYGVYVGEIVAPILLVIGLKTRSAATLVIFTMLVAIYVAHPNDIFALNRIGAPVIELPLFYIFVSLAIIFLGAGKYSVDKS